MIYVTLLICASLALLYGLFILLAHQVIKKNLDATQKRMMITSFACAIICFALWFVHKKALIVILSIVLGLLVCHSCYMVWLSISKGEKRQLRPILICDIVAVLLLAFAIISNDEWNIYRPNKNGEPYRLTVFGRYNYQQKTWNRIKADKMARKMEANRLNARNRLQSDEDKISGKWYCKNVIGLPYTIEFYNGRDVLLIVGSKYNSMYNGGSYRVYGNEVRVRMNGTDVNGSEDMIFKINQEFLLLHLAGREFKFEHVR